MAETDMDDLDVAIVGGGPAGCYLAWRLANADLAGSPLADLAARRPDGKLKIRLYQLDDRVGGRIESIRMDGMPDIAVELGAEGYLVPSSPDTARQYPGHVLVASLVEELGLPAIAGLSARSAPSPLLARLFGERRILPHEPSAEAEPVPGLGPNNPWLLRDHHILTCDLTKPGVLPYKLTQEEESALNHPCGLFGYACDQVVPEATACSYVDWQELRKTAEWKGRPLYTYEIGEVLRDVLSKDGYQFLLDTACVPEMYTVMNAADAMALLFCNDLAPMTLMHVDAGYQAIPNMLRDRFVMKHQDGWRPHHRLAWVDSTQDGSTLLRFETRGGGAAVARAAHLVLAMPRAALEQIASSPLFQGDAARALRQDLCAVQPHPIYRQYASYEIPWWQRVDVEGGPGFTTLPIRVSYALGTQPNTQTSLFLVSFRPRKDVGPWHDPQREVKRLFNTEAIPPPLQEVEKTWDGGVEGGAWNGWRPGVRSWEVTRRMLKPIEGVNLHVCGEAYSDTQGWTEGALRTCEELLTSQWKLAPWKAT
ncbi:FAD-dependent oxidoreductase [Sorangium sp. So ce542]|uniref:FAD-dependent oxidoreductase n=1 Tax=Sorangium sp. So ce542 TaxID=3133316 RepID=UPI003F60EDCD